MPDDKKNDNYSLFYPSYPFPVTVIAILLPFTRVVNILAPFLPPRVDKFVETRPVMNYGFVDGYQVCVRAV